MFTGEGPSRVFKSCCRPLTRCHCKFLHAMFRCVTNPGRRTVGTSSKPSMVTTVRSCSLRLLHPHRLTPHPDLQHHNTKCLDVSSQYELQPGMCDIQESIARHMRGGCLDDK